MAEVLKVDGDNPDSDELKRVCEAIYASELVIYPTETVYGLGADAASDEAVVKVFKAKSRPLEEPISVAVDSLSMSYQVGKIYREGEDLIQEFLPGPLTIIVEARPLVSNLLLAGTEKVGIRIPDQPVTLKLIEMLRGPITSTSANITGNQAPRSVDEALDQLGEFVEFAIDTGPPTVGKSSTVVDTTGDDLSIIRKGPISESEIRSVIE